MTDQVQEYINYQIQNYCEVNTDKIIPKKGAMVIATTKNNLPALYKAIREAKNKKEAGHAMRQFIVWNDIPIDVWDKLEEWFPAGN